MESVSLMAKGTMHSTILYSVYLFLTEEHNSPLLKFGQPIVLPSKNYSIKGEYKRNNFTGGKPQKYCLKLGDQG